MNKGVVCLLAASIFLVIAGIVFYLWSLFNTGSGDGVGGVVPSLLLLVGVLGLNISWVLHDAVERLTRLERNRDGKISSAKPGDAEAAAATNRHLPRSRP